MQNVARSWRVRRVLILCHEFLFSSLDVLMISVSPCFDGLVGLFYCTVC